MSMSPMDLVAEAKQNIAEIEHEAVEGLLNGQTVILDVREHAEFEAGFLPGAVNIPRGVLEFRVGQHPATADKDAEYVVYCKTGGRAALACWTLKRMGYANVRSIVGGFDAWTQAGRSVAKDPAVC